MKRQSKQIKTYATKHTSTIKNIIRLAPHLWTSSLNWNELSNGIVWLPLVKECVSWSESLVFVDVEFDVQGCLLRLEDSVTESLPVLWLPSVGKALVGEVLPEVSNITAEDRVQKRRIARAEELVDKAVGHRVLTVASLALGATQAGVVRKVLDGQLNAVGGGAEESVDELSMGIALIGAECDVGAGERCIMLNNVQGVEVMKVDPSTALIEQVRGSGQLITEGWGQIVSPLDCM